MRRTLVAVALILSVHLSVPLAHATEKLTFEVVSVKPSQPPAPGGRFMVINGRGGPGTADPERISSSNVTLKSILASAYDVKSYQIAGPDWLANERYDIVAKVPSGATKDRVKLMWRNLLTDRFGVVLHHESKDFRVEELVVAKNGPKLTAWVADPAAAAPGIQESLALNVYSVAAKAQPASRLALFLETRLNVPVLDKTGLTGLYDFTLKYDRDPDAAATSPRDLSDPAGSNLAQATQEQLGLKLVAAKATLDVLVIDSASKLPTEN